MLLRYLEKGYKNGRVYQKTEMGPKEIKKKKKNIMEESCTCLKNTERGRSQKLTQAFSTFAILPDRTVLHCEQKFRN